MAGRFFSPSRSPQANSSPPPPGLSSVWMSICLLLRQTLARCSWQVQTALKESLVMDFLRHPCLWLVWPKAKQELPVRHGLCQTRLRTWHTGGELGGPLRPPPTSPILLMGKLRPGEKGLSDLNMILEQAEINPGNALEVQWLKLFASIARGASSITGQEQRCW